MYVWKCVKHHIWHVRFSNLQLGTLRKVYKRAEFQMHCCSTHSALCRCRNLPTVLYYTIMRTVPNGSLMEIYCITYRLLLFILYVILLVDILYITEPQSVEVFILTNVSAAFIENKYNSHYRSTILLEFLGECRLRCDLRKVNKCT